MYHVHSEMVHRVQMHRAEVSTFYTQLKPAELKLASQLIMTLLKDVMVHCIAYKRDVKAEYYHTPPTKGEVKMASQVLCRLANTSPEKCITISTGGTVNHNNTKHTGAGLGLLGEQGAESIHARFKTLQRTYIP